MAESFNCPNCGAPLDYDRSHAATMRCPFCGNSVIVPNELPAPAPSRKSAAADRAGTIPVQSIGGNSRVALFAIGLIGVVALCLIGSSLIPLLIGRSAIALAPAIPTTSIQEWETVPKSTGTPLPTKTPPSSPTPGYANRVLQFGSKGTGPGLLNNASGIAIDRSGNIYVGELKGSRVQVFDSKGNFVRLWNAGDSKSILWDLAVDGNGTVYAVVDHKISRFDSATGKPLGEIPYAAGGEFHSIAIAADGSLYASWNENPNGVITSIEGHRDDLVHFDAQGQVIKAFRGIVSGQTGDPELDNFVAVDGSGNLFVAGGMFDPCVFKFTPEGKYVNKFGGKGDKPGEFDNIRAIAVDGQSRVYVGDPKGVQVFDVNGRYLGSFKVDGATEAMAIDDQGGIYVETDDQVERFVLSQ